MTQQIKFEKKTSRFFKPKILEKKNSRQLRGRGFPPKKKKKSEDPCGSIRDITAQLIHDNNTSIAEPCIVFNVPSAGYNPRWIYWSYEFLFFDPGDFGPGGRHRPDPEVKKSHSQGLTP